MTTCVPLGIHFVACIDPGNMSIRECIGSKVGGE